MKEDRVLIKKLRQFSGSPTTEAVHETEPVDSCVYLHRYGPADGASSSKIFYPLPRCTVPTKAYGIPVSNMVPKGAGSLFVA